MIVKILGRAFDTFSEEWRHQCEVNYVFRMSEGRRNIYLSSFHDKTGPHRPRSCYDHA
jgi:hypothetical protein